MTETRRSADKILVCITEDWFALSHFQPLLTTLAGLAHEVVVATRSSGRLGEIEALGCRTVDFDFRRSSLDPVAQAQTSCGGWRSSSAPSGPTWCTRSPCRRWW